jgi:uncharacterized protein (TIGR00290 family)
MSILLSWSGGKDSALALARLREDRSVEVAGLVTTVTAEYERVSIHGVRRVLLHAQAASLGLPVVEIEIPPASTNEDYERAWATSLKTLPPDLARARHLAFGDIFLEDVRRYRERMAAALGFTPLFPVWGETTRVLAREVIDGGFGARVVCVDTQQLAAGFVGRAYDDQLLADLPASVDPCGERGEFHTFVHDGPGFGRPIPYRIGEIVLRDDRFAYCDLMPTGSPTA